MATSFVAVELLRPKLMDYDSDLLDRKKATQKKWSCIICTYLNDSNCSKCGLCLTQRTVVPIKSPKSKKRFDFNMRPLTPRSKSFTPKSAKKREPKMRPLSPRSFSFTPKSAKKREVTMRPLSPRSKSFTPKSSRPLSPRRFFAKSLQSSKSAELNESNIIAIEPVEFPDTETLSHHNKRKRKTKYTKTKTKKKKKKTKLYALPPTQTNKIRSKHSAESSIYGATNFSFAQCVSDELKSALNDRNIRLIALEQYEKSVQKHESILLEILKYSAIGKDVINTITVARCDVLCHFLPLIAFTLCQCNNMKFTRKLMNQLRDRIVGQSDLRQALKFFMSSYDDIECVSSVFNGICNDDKDHINFWFNIVKRKDIAENECITVPLNTILRDPVKQLSSPIHKVIVRKVINSNSKPLLIDCYGSNTTNGFLSSRFILKYGDDLRKDKSCMLVFKWINHLFIKNKKLKDIKILTYNVIPMSKSFGCIQLIPDCIPLRNILCLSSDINNKRKLLTNLISSSVGSYISSYIMGVRDRHFDNILIRRTDCTLFHIDMGYVLGDTITGLDANKFGITKEFYDILGADNYKIFIDLCINAFQELRHYHQELINFACLAFSYVYDYAIIRQYITKQLRMNESDKKASLWLKTQLINAPFNKQTILKNVIHKYATR